MSEENIKRCPFKQGSPTPPCYPECALYYKTYGFAGCSFLFLARSMTKVESDIADMKNNTDTLIERGNSKW